jgi:hypothetical protein
MVTMRYVQVVMAILALLEEVMIFIFVMILIQKIPIIAIWEVLTQEDYNIKMGVTKLKLF